MGINTKGIQDWITVCQNPEDVLKAEVTNRILAIITQKNKNLDISRYYDNFLKNFPINQKNLDELIWFFEDEKNQNFTQEIFSKLYLLVGDENKDFVNSFLKDKEWNNDSSKTITYIIKRLKNYPFVAQFPIDNIEVELTEKTLSKSHRFFKYKTSKKLGLIAQSKDALINTQNIYSNINYIKDNVFLCIIWNTWEFIKFNWENFEKIQTINDINWVPETIFDNWDIIYKTINDKRKFIPFDNIWASLSNEEYDKIENKFWIIFAKKTNKENPANIDLDVVWANNKLSFNSINWYEMKNLGNVIILLKIQTNLWINYYEIKDKEIREISYLKNINAISDWFFKSNLGFIQNSEKLCWLVTLIKDQEAIFFPIKWEIQESVLLKDIAKKQYFWLEEKNYPCFVVDSRDLYIFDRQNKKLYKYINTIQFVREKTKVSFEKLKNDKSLIEVEAENF